MAGEMNDVVSLGWGVPSFKTPTHIREAVRKALVDDDSLGTYSPLRGLYELREAIAARLESQEGVKIDPQQEIAVTVGAMEALFATLLAIVDPGDEIILPVPGFGPHASQVLLAGATPVYVNLDEENGWKLDAQQIERAMSPRTKAMIVTHPSNPTGGVFGEEELKAVAELALKYNFYLIMDETYRALIYDDQKLFNVFRIPEMREKVVSCYSFSKEYAMTGWRVGYVYAEKRLIQEILKVHDALVVSAPRISQIAALAALQGPQDCVQEFKEELAARRNLICQHLDRLPNLFAYHKPEGTFYIFPRLKLAVDSFQFALTLLKEAKVVIIPGNAFGPDGKDHVRLCFSTERWEITECFNRLERFIAHHHDLL
ncbi:pyridoxal phosphate-dependent aminotransferase [Dictyobacter arantiisoli]|uniref:pyridoxal phosphate-dependent aminotransferase n=1 Tax=Dictyobacter arantiisoli TaxID=2014874 RepID=UPI00155ADD4D|nr:pyridoxal phosphate-dependent aminotransferase [Dictyobacter arantiisoli]